jgi:hypothetical protein
MKKYYSDLFSMSCHVAQEPLFPDFVDIYVLNVPVLLAVAVYVVEVLYASPMLQISVAVLENSCNKFI